MMSGDYTKVPLRPAERWTAARMQQGRVLLDHDWNLNIDAAARASRAAAADIVGAAGVVAGTDAFEIGVTPSGTLDLTVQSGRFWVDGLAALAPADFGYLEQDQIAPLPAGGRVLAYLDAWEEHVAPAEDPSLVDPALAPIDTTARTRIGYRVRVAATTAATCKEAWQALAPTLTGASGGRLTIHRTAPAGPADPCAPPGDPQGQLPNGLFRVEVLDSGTAATARFAWSFENGATAVAIARDGLGAPQIAGDVVTLVPSASVHFATDDRVEVSWLVRRADRVAHGALYRIAEPPATGAGGDVLTLDRAVTVPPGAEGLVVRRWDGERVGAAAAAKALLRGTTDLGVEFIAGSGGYLAGDWWGSRLRLEEGVGLEERASAEPDGLPHVFAPLALVDLGARSVLGDCRPTFVPLTDLRVGGGSCTVTAKPGDNLQAALDSVPADGGELCLAAGLYPLGAPLAVTGRRRVVICGAGPATILRAATTEAALLIQDCTEVEVHHVRVEGGAAAGAGEKHLGGAVTVVGSKDITIADCALSCPESRDGFEQTCLTVRSGAGGNPTGIRVDRNRMSIGPWQTGVLIVDAGEAVVSGNAVSVAPDDGKGLSGSAEAVGRAVSQLVRSAIRPAAGPGTKIVLVAGTPVNVLAASEATPLIDAVAGMATAGQVQRRGAARALLSAARRGASADVLPTLPPAARAVVTGARQGLRSAWQGIVVGGSTTGSVQILDNVVEGVVQGIHIGVSQAAVGREAVGEVIVARNVVHARVPRLYDRDRFAVFVGNARSIHVTDTVASLASTGGPTKLPPVPIEGIRLHGEFGPFICVRQSSLRGFATGVVVKPLVVPDQRMWIVAETMAVGATKALAAPASVISANNVP
jgi:hypothetical protein